MPDLVYVDTHIDKIIDQQEANDIAGGLVSELAGDLAIKFNKERGKTILGAKQGEHATAYGLLKELAITMVKRYVTKATKDKFSGLTNLQKEFKNIIATFQALSEFFNLTPTINAGAESKELEIEIDNLRDWFNDRFEKHNNVVLAMGDVNSIVRKTDNLALTEEAYQIIKELTEETSKAMKMSVELRDSEVPIIRRDYFFAVVAILADDFLKIVNKAPFTTFARTEENQASASAKRIRNRILESLDKAEEALNNTQEMEEGVTRLSISTGSKASRIEGIRKESQEGIAFTPSPTILEENSESVSTPPLQLDGSPIIGFSQEFPSSNKGRVTGPRSSKTTSNKKSENQADILGNQPEKIGTKGRTCGIM